MPDAVIVAAARSPIGRARKGSLVSERADDLAAQIARSLFDSLPQFDPAELDEVYAGCGLPGGEQGGNLGRIVPVMLGLDGVPGSTINRYCASSMQTTRMAAHSIWAGEGDAYLSLGVESVSRVGSARNPDPTALECNALFASRAPRVPWRDPRADGLVPDLFVSMGETAENVADIANISRERMDEFAARSQAFAAQAKQDGFWELDITPVTLADGTVVHDDDSPRPGTTLAGLAALEPVFRENGRVTAGNCCPMNDGAAALLVMSDERARALGLTPLARIVSTAASAVSPEIMGLGPVEASRKALKQAALSIEDIGLVEINEAFAAQVIPCYEQLGAPLEKVNVKGGAIALGHPYGMSGARITTTLINALRWEGKRYGLQTMCVAGGQGMAMVIERLG